MIQTPSGDACQIGDTSQPAERFFLADFMLGKLARQLRMAGFDTLYPPPRDYRVWSLFGRTILTCNTRFGERFHPPDVIVLKPNSPISQLRHVIQCCNLRYTPERFLSRCLICNVGVLVLSGDACRERVPLQVWRNHEDFSYCPVCRRIYWPGSHARRMQAFWQKMVAETSETAGGSTVPE